MIYQTLVVLSVLYVLSLVLPRRARHDGLPSIPVVSSFIPGVGIENLISFVWNRPAFIEKNIARYGPVYAISIFGKNIVFVNHPASLPQIERQTKIIDDRREIERAAAAASGLSEPKLMTNVMLDSLIPLVIRTLSTNLLSNDEASEIFCGLVQKELDVIAPVGGPSPKLCLWEFIARTIYRTSSVFLFGSTFPIDSYEDLAGTLHNITLVASPLGKVPFFSGTKHRNAALKALEKYLEPCWEDEADVELILRDANKLIIESVPVMKKAGLSITEAAGIFIGFLFGIHGNVWFVLHQLFGRVLLEPEYCAKIVEEVRQTEDITKMKYLESAMWEALRRPYRFVQIRRATGDVEIQLGKDGTRYFVEEGTWFLIKSFNHDPSVFPDPYEFKPGRFVDPAVTKPRPFGDGHRVCKGRDFAKWQMLKFAAMIFRQFDLTILDKSGSPITDLPTARANFKPDGSLILFDKIDGKDETWIELKRRATN